jgi:anti-sigma-K factor RskA
LNFSDREEREVLAGEYVLGLLSPQDKHVFESELAKNRELARSVALWQDRLLEMAPAPDPVTPGPQLWPRIAGDLHDVQPRTARPGLWRSLQFWRFVSLAGLASAALAIVLGWNVFFALTQPAVFTARYVAVLQDSSDKRPDWLVEVGANDTVRLTPLARTAVGPRQSLELWTKPEGAPGPVSLGLVSAEQRTIIPAPKLPGFSASQFFAISPEPEAGSPTGSPTGPILATGDSVQL